MYALSLCVSVCPCVWLQSIQVAEGTQVPVCRCRHTQLPRVARVASRVEEANITQHSEQPRETVHTVQAESSDTHLVGVLCALLQAFIVSTRSIHCVPGGTACFSHSLAVLSRLDAAERVTTNHAASQRASHQTAAGLTCCTRAMSMPFQCDVASTTVVAR